MITETMKKKAAKLAELLGAKNWKIDDGPLGWEYQLDFADVQQSAAARKHGGQGDVTICFHTTRALHAYLDDKIKLFGA